MWDEVQSLSKHFYLKQDTYCLGTVSINTLLPSPILHPGLYQLACTHSHARVFISEQDVERKSRDRVRRIKDGEWKEMEGLPASI